MTVNFDHSRKSRTGIAEAILAEPKTQRDLMLALNKALEKSASVLVTRVTEIQLNVFKEHCLSSGFHIFPDAYERTFVVSNKEWVPKIGSDQVAILSGGTSDELIVEEIRLSLKYFGIASTKYSDIGVAGIHRHKSVLKEIERNQSHKLIIVVAGNEGALFTVISAQTLLPVVAVPSSIRYGFGGKGITALQSALQSCSPGVVTVNIDNGFGAAAFASKMIATYDG